MPWAATILVRGDGDAKNSPAGCFFFLVDRLIARNGHRDSNVSLRCFLPDHDWPINESLFTPDNPFRMVLTTCSDLRCRQEGLKKMLDPLLDKGERGSACWWGMRREIVFSRHMRNEVLRSFHPYIAVVNVPYIANSCQSESIKVQMSMSRAVRVTTEQFQWMWHFRCELIGLVRLHRHVSHVNNNCFVSQDFMARMLEIFWQI